MTTTTFAKTDRSTAAWHVIDATDEVLGRMAARVAQILQGKHKPSWTPHADTGDFVVVINAEKIQVTGRKAQDKFYRRYTGFHGGLRTEFFPRMLERKPTEIIKLAVRRMLPKTDLGRHMLAKLKIVAGSAHEHHAQAPKALALGTSRASRAGVKSNPKKK
jgi:large subunit ribosomal protein L13